MLPPGHRADHRRRRAAGQVAAPLGQVGRAPAAHALGLGGVLPRHVHDDNPYRSNWAVGMGWDGSAWIVGYGSERNGPVWRVVAGSGRLGMSKSMPLCLGRGPDGHITKLPAPGRPGSRQARTASSPRAAGNSRDSRVEELRVDQHRDIFPAPGDADRLALPRPVDQLRQPPPGLRRRVNLHVYIYRYRRSDVRLADSEKMSLVKNGAVGRVVRLSPLFELPGATTPLAAWGVITCSNGGIPELYLCNRPSRPVAVSASHPFARIQITAITLMALLPGPLGHVGHGLYRLLHLGCLLSQASG
jgi:hypothetical protein